MSGETIPYQLRQNKAVDRHAFMELLSKFDKYQDISQYRYIGFGGHSLEDFKYIHARFDIKSMISLELNDEVHKRQKFNVPHSCIDCQLISSNEFISGFSRDEKTIFWLDYTSPSDLRSQIEEFQATLGRLHPFDIVKISLNAHAPSYVFNSEGMGIDDLSKKRFEFLRNALGDLFPSGSVSQAMMTSKKFPDALNQIVKYSSSLSLRGQRGVCFQPLTSFSYADGQTMLTVTGVILVQDTAEEFFRKTGIKDWPLSNTDWSNPIKIDVPNLTIKERLYIDSFLPDSDVDTIQQELGFLFDKKEKVSKDMLKTYMTFYRQSPYFSRMLF